MDGVGRTQRVRGVGRDEEGLRGRDNGGLVGCGPQAGEGEWDIDLS